MTRPNRVAIIGADWPDYEKYCPNFVGMQVGLSEMGIEHRLFSCRPELDTEAVIEYEPDLMIYGLIDMVREYTWRHKLRAALPDAKIVMWYGDYRDESTGQIRADMSEIDAMFVSNNAQSRYYQDIWQVKECHFLPLGAAIFSPLYNTNLSVDFLFVGAMIHGRGFEQRAQQISELIRHGLRVIDAPAQFQPKLRAKILRDMPSLYHSAKVTLDWSHFTHVPGYTSNRFWIITASGGFALTKRWPGCTDFYPEGTRAYFDTVEEALELRDYYLTHTEEREKIRAAGYAQAINHTYSNRFAIMFDVIYGTSQNGLSFNRIPTS